MWILINSTQYLVYIGMWQINYSNRTSVLFKQIKRVFLGEYLDELEMSKKISEAFNIKASQSTDAPEQ